MTELPMLVTDLLQQQAELIPTKTAIVDRSGEYTYAELNAQADQVAYWLCNINVKPGDRIVLCGANGVRLVVAIFGILKVGAIFVPLHPDIPISRLEYVLENCTPTAIIADSQLLLRCEDAACASCNTFLLTADTVPTQLTGELNVTPWSALNQYNGSFPNKVYLPTDLAAIIYTSGSTKDPRGVMLPHRQILFATSAINQVLENTSEDNVLCGLPLSFDYGLYQIFLCFHAGAKLILERDFRLPIILPRLIKRHEVTGFPGVPSLFGMLLRSRLLERTQLPSLRYITSTGDVFPPAYIQQLQELLPKVTVFPMYGLTECKRVSIVPQGCLMNRESSVGLPLPGTSAFVVDETGCVVSPGTVGELVVQGPHVMAGYWGNPHETAKRFRVDPQTSEPTLYTGDFFYKDTDGFLYFVGRHEMFIKSRGHKISPLEVESAIYEVEGVAEASVVGIPDTILGEAIFAFVSWASKKFSNIHQIEAHCRVALPPAARPTTIIELKSLPKTENGKIDRRYLQKLATERQQLG